MFADEILPKYRSELFPFILNCELVSQGARLGCRQPQFQYPEVTRVIEQWFAQEGREFCHWHDLVLLNQHWPIVEGHIRLVAKKRLTQAAAEDYILESSSRGDLVVEYWAASAGEKWLLHRSRLVDIPDSRRLVTNRVRIYNKILAEYEVQVTAQLEVLTLGFFST